MFINKQIKLSKLEPPWTFLFGEMAEISERQMAWNEQGGVGNLQKSLKSAGQEVTLLVNLEKIRILQKRMLMIQRLDRELQT
jgi:hypothetical protein